MMTMMMMMVERLVVLVVWPMVVFRCSLFDVFVFVFVFVVVVMQPSWVVEPRLVFHHWLGKKTKKRTMKMRMMIVMLVVLAV